MFPINTQVTNKTQAVAENGNYFIWIHYRRNRTLCKILCTCMH